MALDNATLFEEAENQKTRLEQVFASTSDGFLAEVSVAERNMLGRGLYGKAAVQYGQYARGFSLSFVEPYFLGYRVALGLDVFEQFDHHPLGRQDGRQAVKKKTTRDVDERQTSLGERVEAKRLHGVSDDPGAGLLGCGARHLGDDRRAKEQFVPEHASRAIEDGLPRDEDLRGSGGGAAASRSGIVGGHLAFRAGSADHWSGTPCEV
jgi:hypothetical protein